MRGKLTLRDRKFVIIGENGEERALPCHLLERIARVPHEGDSLRLLAFSDFRVQNLSSLAKFIKSQDQPDLILYGGDDIRRFHEDETNFLERLADNSRYGLCAVAGNDDRPEVRDLITGRNVYSVHSCPLVLGSFAIVGIEGAPMFPMNEGFDESYNKGYLLYPERVLGWHMKQWTKAGLDQKHLIVLSHAPPYGVLDFAKRFGQRNIGSRPLRQFLQANSSALLCVSGHVHGQGARSEKLGSALVVNAASHDWPGAPGKVAMIQIMNGKISAPDWHTLY